MNQDSTSDKQPKTTRGQRTREKLLRAAEAEFGEKGFHTVGINDITRRAGVALGTFYVYFESKEEIFAAVVREAAEQVTSTVRRAVDGADTAEAKLMAFFEARYSYLELIDGLTRTVAIELYPMVEEAISEFEAQGREILEGVLEFGAAQGAFDVDDARALALGLMTGMRGMDSMFIMHSADADTIDGLRALLRVFLKGLRTRSS
jgi:AcrR family transcriptional regulator